MIIIAQHNQSLLDLAIQETGSVNTAMQIAVANDLAVTQLLEVGQEIVIPEELEGNDDILRYYKKNNLQPVTGGTVSNGDPLFEAGLFENGLFE